MLNKMLAKFRGTLYGVLVGDCFGALFQESSILSKGSRLVLRNFFDSLEKEASLVGLRKSYTDDTAQTLAVARTLTLHKQIDQKALAINLVEEFYKNVYRGYNTTTVEIFSKLKHTHFDDVLYPARETLNDGLGDNGCAMYVAPIALFCAKNAETSLNENVQKATAVTHLHEMAVNGAVLQANAIQELVKLENNLNIDIFLDQMIDFMKQNCPEAGDPSYVEQLQQLKKLLNVVNPSEERVINVLGHSTQALYSVPTAMYCFLRGMKHPSDANPFRQAIEYAITLGGHANTIASMTGALSGAYYGDSTIPPNMLKQCEGFDEIKEISQNLYNIQ